MSNEINSERDQGSIHDLSDQNEGSSEEEASMSAQKMLVRTEFPLSEVALAVGFSDQSHLARHFRHMLGTTPRDFRWSQR